MSVQKVRPDDGNREGKWVVLTIVAILSSAAILMPYHQVATEKPDIQAHQVLITDLHQNELGLIAELKLAHEEIRDLQLETGTWPEVSDMEAIWIAPFVKDQNWKRKGSHQWQRIDDGVYIGVKTSAQGSVSMLLDSRGSQADIWFSDSSRSLNAEVLSDLAKRRQHGWQQIVLSDSSSSHSHAH